MLLFNFNISCVIYVFIHRDIRSVHGDDEQIKTFGTRAEVFFQKFLANAGGFCTNAMPYLHYLRNHLAELMETLYDIFGWGYGVFTTNAGEHLNKRIKYYELNETNLSDERFQTVIHLMRSKQFFFTKTVIPSQKVITCSACNEEGHNRKNKSCPLHPSHPQLDASDFEKLRI